MTAALDQLPHNMRAKATLELCPLAGLEGFCWAWTGALNSRGYGCIGIDGKSQLSHRVAYQLLVGPIPAGMQIDHLCENKRCCNPAHLEPVTGKVNCERTAAARKTMCVHGHPLSGGNLIVKRRPGGRAIRNCRTCQYEAQRRSYARTGKLSTRKLPGRTGAYLLDLDEVRRYAELAEASA